MPRDRIKCNADPRLWLARMGGEKGAQLVCQRELAAQFDFADCALDRVALAGRQHVVIRYGWLLADGRDGDQSIRLPTRDE